MEFLVFTDNNTECDKCCSTIYDGRCYQCCIGLCKSCNHCKYDLDGVTQEINEFNKRRREYRRRYGNPLDEGVFKKNI